MTNGIAVQNIVKQFGDFTAVNGVASPSRPERSTQELKSSGVSVKSS
jgi:hypothetical protein